MTRAGPGAGQGLLWGPGVPALPLPSAGHSAATCLPSRKAQGYHRKGACLPLTVCASVCTCGRVCSVCG